MADTKKKILIFNVNWLGDVLFSTATIRNIRYNFPDSFISCIVPSRCYPVLEGNPYLDKIITFDEKKQYRGILGKLKFTKMLKSEGFDTVFLLHRSFRRALICRLADIPERVGYYTYKRAFLLTKSIPLPPKDVLHRTDYYLNIIQSAGLKVKDRHLDFFVSADDLKFVENFLSHNSIKKDEFLIAINPGGNWLPKRWPKEHWAELADALIEFGGQVVITGSTSDLNLAKSLTGLMKKRPIIACGDFNLKQFGALCKRVSLFISADTGPLHIANAVKAEKIVAIFGPTSPLITGPYPVDNIVLFRKELECKVPCYVVNCKHNRCMLAVTPGEIMEKIKLLMVNKG